jgi:hypothetical protein
MFRSCTGYQISEPSLSILAEYLIWLFIVIFLLLKTSAAQAVLKVDGHKMADHTLSVAISNPPTRNTPLSDREPMTFVPSLGGGKKDTEL